MEELKFDNVYDWVEFGRSQGWIAPPTCYHHDAFEVTPEEDAEMEEGGDPCITIIRVW